MARKAKDLPIPGALKQFKRWTFWQAIKTSSGKLTKKPACSTLQFSTFLSWDKVANTSISEINGIGFILTNKVQQNNLTLIALDIDACLDPKTNKLAEWAKEIVEHYKNTYIEITPSGTGLRVWLWAKSTPPPLSKIHIPYPAPDGVFKRPEIQIFGLGPAGYVAVTGDKFPGSNDKIAVYEDLKWLLEKYPSETYSLEIEDLPIGKDDPPTLDEIEKELRSTERGNLLVDGQWEQLKKPSASEAYYELEMAVLKAARGHGELAVQFLLERTAFGKGLVDSRDPARYQRRDWVIKDLCRIATKINFNEPNQIFKPLNADDWLLNEEQELKSSPKKKLLILPAYKFINSVKQQRFLYYNFLPAVGLAQIFGEPSSGKTPFALSLALHSVLELNFFGFELERTGPVLYMVGEDAAGIRDRTLAQLAQLDPLADLKSLPLYFTTRPGQLIDLEDVKIWLSTIREEIGKKLTLLVIDTQARNFGPGNENATEDMNKFIENVDGLARTLSCLVLLVHHTGHMHKHRGRGASVLPGALDAQIEIKRNGIEIRAITTKAKNWATPEPLTGYLHPVTIGTDEKGRPRTAITLSKERFDVVVDLNQDQIDDIFLFVSALKAAKQAVNHSVSEKDFANFLGLSRRQFRDLTLRLHELAFWVPKKGRGRTKTKYHITESGLQFLKDHEAWLD